MKILTQVTLGLENSTEITIPAKSISLLELGGINALTSIVTPCNRQDFRIRFRMKLDYFSHYNGTREDAEYFLPFIFGSERYNITDITLNYYDGSEITVRPPWKSEHYETENSLEQLTYLEHSKILIEISD